MSEPEENFNLSSHQRFGLVTWPLTNSNIYVDKFGVLNKVRERVEASSHEMPTKLRIVFEGTYGSGKTHSLKQAIKIAEELGVMQKKPYPIYAKLQTTGSKNFIDIYKLVIYEELGENEIMQWLHDMYSVLENDLGLRGPKVTQEEKIEKIHKRLTEVSGFSVNEEMVMVIMQALKSDYKDDIRKECWKYLAGYPAKKDVLGVNEDASKNVEIAMKNFLTIIHIFNIGHPDQIIIFAFDELEKIAQLSKAHMETYAEGFRQLLDVEPVGVMMTETPESGNKFLQVGPIKSRIGGGNYIELATLSPADSPKWIKQFLKEFRPDNDDWKNNLKVAKDKCPDNEGGITEETFPFTEASISGIVQRVGRLGLVPRHILGEMEGIIAKAIAKEKDKKFFISKDV